MLQGSSISTCYGICRSLAFDIGRIPPGSINRLAYDFTGLKHFMLEENLTTLHSYGARNRKSFTPATHSRWVARWKTRLPVRRRLADTCAAPVSSPRSPPCAFVREKPWGGPPAW
jgi:hypothetical protein